MIKFTSNEDNKQYISIISRKTPTDIILDKAIKLYPEIAKGFYKADKSEILLNLDNSIDYGFSLNELRETLNKIADDIIVSHFCVDIDEPTQRYCG